MKNSVWVHYALLDFDEGGEVYYAILKILCIGFFAVPVCGYIDKRGFEIQLQAKEKAAAICGAAKECPDVGNGRFCRNLVESAVLGYAARVYGDGAETCDKEIVLTMDDFAVPCTLEKAKKAII